MSRAGRLDPRTPPLVLLFRSLFDDLKPKIVAVVHCVRLLLAEFDSPFTSYDLFGDDVATLVSFDQEESVISLHSRAQTPPANSAVGHELVNGALDVYTERVPGELRFFVQFVVRAVMNDDIVRVGIPARPRLRIDDIRKHGFATRIHHNLVVSIEVSVFRVLSFGPMDIWIALSAVSVDSQCFIHLLLLRLCIRRSAEEGETQSDHASKNVLRHLLCLHCSSPCKNEDSYAYAACLRASRTISSRTVLSEVYP